MVKSISLTPFRRSYLKLAVVLLLVAILSLLSSLLFQVHAGNKPTAYQVFDISFYHFVPFFLWLLYLPFVDLLAKKWPIKDRRYWIRQVIASVLFAFGSRVLAIWIDFAIKYAVGMTDATPSSVLWEVRWVVVASFPKELLLYWLVVFLLSYFDRSAVRPQLTKLVFDTDQGTLILSPEKLLCLESARNYVVIHTSERKYRARKTLKSILPALDDRFVQIHRSKVVNKEAVNRIIPWRSGEYMLALENGLHVSSSRSFQGSIRRLLSRDEIRPAMV